MNSAEFEAQIKSFDSQTKQTIVEKFSSMRGEWIEDATEELVPLIYKTMGWPVEDMSFKKTEFSKKYFLVRSIYTILQMKKKFWGKPVLICHKCQQEMTLSGRNFECKSCNVVVDFNPDLMEV